METNENIEKRIEELGDIKKNLRKVLMERIRDFVERRGEAEPGGKFVSFKDGEGLEDAVEYLTVSYNGGNHPEYASNCYSEVIGIGIRNDEVYLEIEDCPYYFIEREIWSIDEIIDIYHATLGADEWFDENPMED